MDKQISVMGSLSGLVGSGLQLQDSSDGGTYPVGQVFTGPAANGTDVFGEEGIPPGTPFSFTVKTQPTNPSQTCVVKNGSGIAGTSNVTNVLVTCTTDPARFVYVTNSGSNNVSAYTVDANNGTLSPVAGSPFATGNLPAAVAVDLTGTYVYVANQTDATISAFTVDRTNGSLSEVSGSPFPTGPTPTSVAVGKTWPPLAPVPYVYVTSGTANTVTPYVINSGGSLTMVSSTFATGASPSSVTVSPLWNYLYVADQGDDTVSVLNFDPPGDAVTRSPFSTGTGPGAVAVDTSGDYVYVANSTSSTLSVYHSGSAGPLTPLSGSPYPTGASPSSVAVHPLDNFVYVANKGSNNISAYAVSAGTLTELAGSPFAAGAEPASLAVDPTGRFVYVANAGSADVSVFTVNMGALALAIGPPTAAGSGPSAIAVSQ
jgi:6-phosphogluconolactonase (cycloisomerase 2 family)